MDTSCSRKNSSEPPQLIAREGKNARRSFKIARNFRLALTDVALPTSGEGLRAELGELFGVGAAGRVPLHDAPGRKGRKILIINNKMGFMNFRSYPEFVIGSGRIGPGATSKMRNLHEPSTTRSRRASTRILTTSIYSCWKILLRH